MKRLLLIIFVWHAGISLNAQDEQFYKPLVMQIENGRDTVSYVMDTYNYNISKYTKDTISGTYPSVLHMNFSLSAVPDKILLEWLSVPGHSKNGRIVCKDSKTGVIFRQFTFKNAVILSWNESLSEYYLKEGNKNQLYIEMKCNEFTIDNFPLSNVKSAYDEW